ncbi:MAG: ROK family protein, partial [Muribaculaceae bacterium]|nr:ROK family protein [Muribaculaceae bacterium]
YIDALNDGIQTLVRTNGAEGLVHGVGVGAPNANYYTGKIEYAPNLVWKGELPLAEALSAKTGLPVSITNDANAAAIGEMTYGAARGMKDFIMITLGTGGGGGVVCNGSMVYGFDGMAGELGHITARRNGRLCGCGRHGCLETYCSATGVVRTAYEFLEARIDEPTLLRDRQDLTSKDIYDAAVAGDKLAQDVFEFTGKVLGEMLAEYVSFTSPQAIIIFGGLAKSGELLMKPLRESFEANNMPIHKGKVKILLSELKEADAAVLGASALGWEAKA